MSAFRHFKRFKAHSFSESAVVGAPPAGRRWTTLDLTPASSGQLRAERGDVTTLDPARRLLAGASQAVAGPALHHKKVGLRSAGLWSDDAGIAAPLHDEG